MNDLRYAARTLTKTPGFTVVAVGLLAAGIGANAVIFAALDAVLLRPLPVRHPEQLVRLVQKTPATGNAQLLRLSPIRKSARPFDDTLRGVRRRRMACGDE